MRLWFFLLAFSSLIGVTTVQAQPLPPIKPKSLTLAYQQSVLGRLAVRMGLDYLGKFDIHGREIQLEDIENYLNKIAPYTAYIPSWVNELERDKMLPSIHQLAECGILASDMPTERPDTVQAVLCANLRLHQNNKIVRSIFLVERMDDRIAFGRIYIHHEFGPLQQLALPRPNDTSTARQ